MKNMAKQIGKALCYVLLFVGIQGIVSFVATFIYGWKAGVEAAASGGVVDQEALTTQLMAETAKNMSWMLLVSGVVTLFFLWIFFAVRKKKFLQEVSIVAFESKKLIPVLLIGIASAVFVSLVMRLIPEAVLEAYAESSYMLTEGSLVAVILGNIIMVPIVEEVVFRGLVLSRLRRAMPEWAAIVLSALAFALMNGQIVWMAYAFVLGILLGIVATRTKSVLASMILHMIFNLLGYLMQYMETSVIGVIAISAVSMLVLVASLWTLCRPQARVMGNAKAL